MENVDIKTVIYVIAAIIWFLYSSFNKDKKQQKKTAAAPPPLSESEVKEIIKRKTEKLKTARPIESVEPPVVYKGVVSTVKSSLKNYEEDNYFEDKSEEEKNNRDDQFNAGNIDPRQMILYSEILRRPVY
jgi:hypothetical protein